MLFREYSGLRYDQMQRWAWFFRYMVAIAQIRHPRLVVDHSWGLIHIDPFSVQLRHAEMSVAAHKGLLTKHRMKVEQFIAQHSGLFPATEHELWPKIEAKTRRLIAELEEAEAKLAALREKDSTPRPQCPK